MIFNLKYTPSQNIFIATYKGFISTSSILEYNKQCQLSYIKEEFLNIYYNNNPKLITNLNEDMNYLKNIAKHINDSNSGINYKIEITKLLPLYN